jgi:hypothetical protein
MTGTNACGKSSIVQHFLRSDINTWEIPFDRFKSVVTVCPKYEMMVVGKYSKETTAGGCDTIAKKAYTQAILDSIWDMEGDILMEGYLIGTRVWINDIININKGRRQLFFIHPNTTLETCFKRIEGRSGKKRHELTNNGNNVVFKKKSVENLIKWIQEESPQFTIIEVDTENKTSKEVCEHILTI